MNQGFDSPNGDFYSQGETESKIGFAVSLKLASLNINSFTFLPYQFPQDPNCKRQSFYKKESVRELLTRMLKYNLPKREKKWIPQMSLIVKTPII